MPVDNVVFLQPFYFGKSNDNYFVDFEHLSDAQMDLILEFADNVLTGSSLRGRNKPSWLDRHGNDIKKSISYKSCNLWHYHAGPHSQNLQPLTPNIRVQNLGDHISDAIIHYTWLYGTNDIVILAFSPQHTKFPLPNDKMNVLRSRIRPFGRYSENMLVRITQPPEDE